MIHSPCYRSGSGARPVDSRSRGLGDRGPGEGAGLGAPRSRAGPGREARGCEARGGQAGPDHGARPGEDRKGGEGEAASGRQR